MTVFAFIIHANLVNERIQLSGYPADDSKLRRIIGSAVFIIRMAEDLLRFLKSDPAFRVSSESLAFLWIKLEAHQ